MVHPSIASLFFAVVAPGQTLDGWRAPASPGVYETRTGKTVLVGLPPSRFFGSRVRFPENIEALLVPVKASDRTAKLSRHYTIGDFLCKGDKSVVAVSPKLVAKLESLIGTLRQQGYQAGKLRLMSAFRTPTYNRAIGNATSRSRHIHGDAADILADDFNRDGTIDRRDAMILMNAVNKLDTAGIFQGGASIYPPNGSHGWFVHTDTRGRAARW